MKPDIYLLLLYSILNAKSCIGWQQWNYSYNPPLDGYDTFHEWQNIWGPKDKYGNLTEAGHRYHGPRPRRGHSLVVINDYLVMFGGRDNDIPGEIHIPKTYNVETVLL